MATVVAAGAQAATVTPLAQSTNRVGNTADVFAAGYGANTPIGAVWSSDPTVTPPPGNVAFTYKSPFDTTPITNSQSFFSVARENGANGALSPVTLTFASAQQSINLLWGSIDTFNTISFYSGATNVYSLTGGALAAMLGLSPVIVPTGFETVALLNFSGFGQAGFDSITFESTAPAFEFALAPVPVPAAGLLLLTALGGVALLRRRKAA